MRPLFCVAFLVALFNRPLGAMGSTGLGQSCGEPVPKGYSSCSTIEQFGYSYDRPTVLPVLGKQKLVQHTALGPSQQVCCQLTD